MENLIHKCIGNYLVIDECFQSQYGEHYPKELAQFIIKLYYHLFKIKIKCGLNHSVLLFDNQVYTWGNNRYGQLGLATSPKGALGDSRKISNIDSPQKLDLPNVKKISCGKNYTMALTYSNEIYAWGCNRYGQLGLNHTSDIDSPHKLDLPNVKKIICGGRHTMALTHFGEIYVWGSNDYGQLGLGFGYGINAHSPQKLDFPNVKKIICRNDHTMIITCSNEVYVWGCNTLNQLGLEHRMNINLPQKLDLSNVKKVVCGYEHTIAITFSNEIYGWGCNSFGELGSGPPRSEKDKFIKSPQKIDLPNVKKIRCGECYTMIITHYNEVYGFGHNRFGELGLGHYAHTSLSEKLDLSNVKKIICESFHTIALTYSNEIYIWGDNEYDRLGLGHNDHMNTPQKLKF
jgi:alpha-tubulin suppressor-like RCC1 family protein